jgi:hypothetical protein
MKAAKADSLTPPLPAWARWQSGELRLLLHVQPGARRTAVAGEHGQRLKVALRSPPVDGKANEELLRFLAEALGLRRSGLRLASGQASREKTIALDCSAMDVLAVLARLVRQP